MQTTLQIWMEISTTQLNFHWIIKKEIDTCQDTTFSKRKQKLVIYRKVKNWDADDTTNMKWNLDNTTSFSLDHENWKEINVEISHLQKNKNK